MPKSAISQSYSQFSSSLADVQGLIGEDVSSQSPFMPLSTVQHDLLMN